MTRFQVEIDGLTLRPRFSRRYAVVDIRTMDATGRPAAVLQTNDKRRAAEFAEELNAESRQ